MSERSRNQRVLLSALRAGMTIVVVLALLVGAVLVSYWIKQSEPTAEREAATRRTSALVETIAVDTGSYRPSVEALGAVQAARDIVLSPRVSGQIISVSDTFTLGGRVRAGDELLRLDPSDYEQALIMRESELLQVQAELDIEEGQQRVARREFELLGKDIDEANRSLVLRVPQIESLRAKLKSAQANVERARIDLDRTIVRAPFSGQILRRSAELGSQVSVGDELARLVGTDSFWVVTTIPLSKLRWIEFADEHGAGAEAVIRHASAWTPDEQRVGRVTRLIGEVDQETRLARVIVDVPRPLGGDDEPALILGSIVQVEIEAAAINNVVRLDRAFLRQGDTVWIMEDEKLRIRKVSVLFSDAEHAYISDGLLKGDRVVTTSLATVVDGLDIRDISSDSKTDTQTAPTAEMGGQTP